MLIANICLFASIDRLTMQWRPEMAWSGHPDCWSQDPGTCLLDLSRALSLPHLSPSLHPSCSKSFWVWSWSGASSWWSGASRYLVRPYKARQLGTSYLVHPQTSWHILMLPWWCLVHPASVARALTLLSHTSPPAAAIIQRRKLASDSTGIIITESDISPMAAPNICQQ